MRVGMIRQMDNIYRLDHAVTKTQKTILKAFGIDAGYIKEKVKIIGDTIAYHEEGKQHGEEKHLHRGKNRTGETESGQSKRKINDNRQRIRMGPFCC